MPKFAANLSMMFNEVSFPDRFSAAAQAGFKGVEYLFPYEFDAKEIETRLKQNSLQNILFNMPPGNWAAGERGIASLPRREKEFADGVHQAIDYANALGCKQIHAMAGLLPTDADKAAYRKVYLGNLQYAAAELAKHDVLLLIEPINTRDIPGYFLNTQAEAFAILEEIAAPNLKMQMDIYHMQIMEGDIETKLRKYLPHVAHIQIARVPGRNEPVNGEINYDYLFALLDELKYDGWIGCEYRPAKGTLEGLKWFEKYR